MPGAIDPALTVPDTLVLENLFRDIKKEKFTTAVSSTASDGDNAATNDQFTDEEVIDQLTAFNNKNDPRFKPTVFTTWDEKDINPTLNKYIVQPYSRVGQKIVRHPTDVVFLTHLLIHFTTIVPSAILLFRHFSYWHAVPHTIWSVFCAGPFTLMMHNHIHNGGILSKQFSLIDRVFPYILEPLMGHTWDSYYYHHVKHHHVEGNGADDLSSTLRYQRDDVFDFLCYVGRFVFFVWLELPLYFLRKGKPGMALKAGLSEYASYAFFWFMATQVNFKATLFAMFLPFGILRFFMMVGNFGQHALVDEIEPDSDFRSSITLVDVPSNRFCFNDGYHTAHHLNPRRHWRDQPLHFIKSKAQYASGRALVFHNIDYNMMTFKLLTKDYLYLADCLVPIGKEQMSMSREEIAAMLKTKTRRFTEADIEAKFEKARVGSKLRKGSERTFAFTQWGHVEWVLAKLGGLARGVDGVQQHYSGPGGVEKTK
ncbi:hypothetical protein AAFC00_004510 [Neodothiora populina]|uniref:Fatty acid desaturase domain-containing protein n=1 Tax=Neodothiora populina TaxID=2781224 RepID=A0ABR3P295_9PEZI